MVLLPKLKVRVSFKLFQGIARIELMYDIAVQLTACSYLYYKKNESTDNTYVYVCSRSAVCNGSDQLADIEETMADESETLAVNTEHGTTQREWREGSGGRRVAGVAE